MKAFVHKHIIFLLLVLPSVAGHTQIKDIGLPTIINHQRHAYDASTQNWSVTQCSRGFMYFGNNDGVLEYNGTNWHTYPMPNGSIVRSVLAAGNAIFAGAYEELGFLAPNERGELAWNSLTHLIPASFRDFDEIWNIYEDDQGRIIFQSFSYIFIYADDEMQVIQPKSEFGFMHEVGGAFYVVERETGLMRLEHDSLSLVTDHSIARQQEISCIIPKSRNQFLVGTSSEGVFLWDGQQLSPWDSPINERLKQDNIYSGTRLSDNSYAFGTISNGVFITDAEGNFVQHVNRSKGLQNNTVLALFEDRKNNLWMALDNGIDYIELNSPFSMLNHNFNIESVYATAVHEGMLYVGTNQGLFGLKLDDISNREVSPPRFQLVAGTEGQVWSLEVIDNTLLCGHNYGSFQVNGFQAREIADIRGFWSFLELPEHDNLLIAGTFSGLVRLENIDGNWYFLDEIEGFRESSRDVFLDDRGQLWVSHGYKGLFQLETATGFSEVTNVHLYRGEKGLPEALPYNLQEVNGKMAVTTHAGVLTYDHQNDVFVSDADLCQLFENKGFIDQIYQDDHGNLWYYTYDFMGLMRRLEDGTFRDITAPFERINAFLLPAFQNISILDANNVFIGSQQGLIHYDPAIIHDYQVTEQVSFEKVSFYGKPETRSYAMHSREILENHEHMLDLPFASNDVSFIFTAPMYENPGAISFSYKLTGFDPDWSDWDALNVKEYTNLREGDYVFQVKARNAFGMESSVSAFHFSINPPLYRSKTAFAIYALLIMAIIAANAYYVRKRILRIRQREKIRHEKRLARREQIFKEQTALSEKEIMELRNESLATEMQHKNKELANATMHLIQKNKTLTSLKNDLNKLLKSIPADHPEKMSIQGLLKKVNRELKNEKHWELFNSYFDEVHQDFIARMKEEYEDLSPKELRLCAYLRMNLSTKEIAPLMNISVRGVEISRYRLRKKMNLDHEVNLTEFLMAF